MTKISPDVMSRLSFIRYFYLLAVEQSRQPEPLSAVSILNFHDSVELFLQLASECKNVGKKSLTFMEYFGIIDPVLAPERLGQKESMRRLNEMRGTFKHSGTLPSPSAIEGFRVGVSNFFEENTPLVFGLAFSEVSMIDLVTFSPAHASLKQAEQALVENDYAAAMSSIAVAFTQLIDNVSTQHRKFHRRSPIYFPKSFGFDSSFFRRRSAGVPTEQDKFEDKLMEAVDGMQQPVMILSFGLDFARYARFHIATPTVRRAMNGEYHIQIMQGIGGLPEWPPSKETCDFCMQFVIESAIRLQQFDIPMVNQT